ncbi:hypothetical protein BCV70DRAFT_200243 [Testicularia cyperi]|uniref:Uncharacterized protein n=1 Tax=Testicularia cyperi TaxID=1882483 RepID=A0A317XP68_9BASI|nr:hypothetical protein BCV70DRAFT_200243 [Testicularia cyperi]
MSVTVKSSRAARASKASIGTPNAGVVQLLVLLLLSSLVSGTAHLHVSHHVNGI